MRSLASSTSGIVGRREAVLASLLTEKGEPTRFKSFFNRIITFGAGGGEPVKVLAYLDAFGLWKLGERGTGDHYQVINECRPDDESRPLTRSFEECRFDLANDTLRVEVLREEGSPPKYVEAVIFRAIQEHIEEKNADPETGDKLLAAAFGVLAPDDLETLKSFVAAVSIGGEELVVLRSEGFEERQTQTSEMPEAAGLNERDVERHAFFREDCCWSALEYLYPGMVLTLLVLFGCSLGGSDDSTIFTAGGTTSPPYYA